MELLRRRTFVSFLALVILALQNVQGAQNSQEEVEVSADDGDLAGGFRSPRSIANLARLLLGGTYVSLQLGNVPANHPLVKYPDPIQSAASVSSNVIAAVPGMNHNRASSAPSTAASSWLNPFSVLTGGSQGYHTNTNTMMGPTTSTYTNNEFPHTLNQLIQSAFAPSAPAPSRPPLRGQIPRPGPLYAPFMTIYSRTFDSAAPAPGLEPSPSTSNSPAGFSFGFGFGGKHAGSDSAVGPSSGSPSGHTPGHPYYSSPHTHSPQGHFDATGGNAYGAQGGLGSPSQHAYSAAAPPPQSAPTLPPFAHQQSQQYPPSPYSNQPQYQQHQYQQQYPATGNPYNSPGSSPPLPPYSYPQQSYQSNFQPQQTSYSHQSYQQQSPVAPATNNYQYQYSGAAGAGEPKNTYTNPHAINQNHYSASPPNFQQYYNNYQQQQQQQQQQPINNYPSASYNPPPVVPSSPYVPSYSSSSSYPSSSSKPSYRPAPENSFNRDEYESSRSKYKSSKPSSSPTSVYDDKYSSGSHHKTYKGSSSKGRRDRERERDHQRDPLSDYRPSPVIYAGPPRKSSSSSSSSSSTPSSSFLDSFGFNSGEKFKKTSPSRERERERERARERERDREIDSGYSNYRTGQLMKSSSRPRNRDDVSVDELLLEQLENLESRPSVRVSPAPLSEYKRPRPNNYRDAAPPSNRYSTLPQDVDSPHSSIRTRQKGSRHNRSSMESELPPIKSPNAELVKSVNIFSSSFSSSNLKSS